MRSCSCIKHKFQFNASHDNCRENICDMIKGNVLHVTNILILSNRLKRGDQFLRFTLLRNFQEAFLSLQPNIWLQLGLNGYVVFWMDKSILVKSQNWILLTCDSFPFIVLHITLWKIGAHISWNRWMFECLGWLGLFSGLRLLFNFH